MLYTVVIFHANKLSNNLWKYYYERKQVFLECYPWQSRNLRVKNKKVHNLYWKRIIKFC